MNSSKSEINSFGKVQMIKCIPTFMWTVKNFCVCHKKTGDPLKSPLFAMGANNELTWCIHLYPRGFDKSYSDYVSLFLQLESANQDEIKVKYKFSILNDKNIKMNEMGSDTDRLFTPGCDWGFREFILRDFLFDEKNGLMPDNKLTVYCEVDVSGDSSSNETVMLPVEISENQNRLIDDLVTLYKNRKFCDVSLVVGDRKFYAHKSILAARSPVFLNWFEQSLQEKKVFVVEINEFDQKVVKELLRYVYTGKVDDLTKIASNLLLAAEKYEIVGLKLLCENAISKSINVDNAAEILLMADTQKAKKLKQEVMDFIILNGESVTNTEGFKKVVAERPLLIAEAFRTVVAKYNTSEIPCKRRKNSEQSINKEQ